MNKLQQLGLAATTAVLSLGIVTAKPAQAALFTFNFAGQGEGSLSFQNAPLTGIGTESISLDDLENLAEDVNFEFSFPFIYYDFGEQYYGNPSFEFENGNLKGINLFGSYSLYYEGTFTTDYRTAYLFVKNDRFLPFAEGTYSAIAYPDCYESYYLDGYDYDPDTGEEIPRYSYGTFCQYSSYDYSGNYQIQDEGISYQVTSISTETLQTPTEYITTEYPDNSSGFLRYDELPQITFTTLERINPNDPPEQITSIPEPQPFTLLGLGTTITFGVFVKQLKRKKDN